MPQLVLEGPNGKRQFFALGAKKITLGRGPANAVVLSDSSVSRTHAELEHRGGSTYILRDLKSTNGTYVNDDRIEKAELRHRDRVRLGNTGLVFLEKEDRVEPEPFSEISLPMFGQAAPKFKAPAKGAHGAKKEGSQTGISANKDYRLLLAFYRLSRVLGPDKAVIDLFRDALVKITEIIGADTGMVFLVNSKSGLLEPFLAVRGADIVASKDIHFSNTMIRKAMSSREAILTSNAMADARFQEAASIVAGKIHSAMSVPLCTKDSVIGVIHVDLRSPTKVFNRDHLEVLRFMANELAVYFENTQLREDLRSGLDKLLGIDKVKYKFITTLGHYVATPITIMNQGMSLLMDGTLGALTDQQKQSLKLMERQTERLVRVVKDLEKITSWDHIWERLQETPEEFVLEGVISEIVEEFRPLFEGTKKTVHCNGASKGTLVKANKRTIREVLRQLIVNAYKFTPEGAKVRVEVQDNPYQAVVMVEDNGTGMTPEELREAFEVVFVGDDLMMPKEEVKKMSPCLGLGLALCRKIVESHKGRIWAESEKGKYARFFFSLPRAHKKKEAA